MIVLTLARKPLIGSVATNVLKHGTGGLNIDGSRIGTQTETHSKRVANHLYDNKWGALDSEVKNFGRWPANLILCHLPGCRKTGTTKVQGNRIDTRPNGDAGRADKTDWRFRPTEATRRGYSDGDGCEQVETWKCAVGCPIANLDEQYAETTAHPSGGKNPGHIVAHRKGRVYCGGYGAEFKDPDFYKDWDGGASHFFKQVQSNEPPESFRASGNCLCPVCGKEYHTHPYDYDQVSGSGEPYLFVLCNGSRVKL